MAVTSGPEDPWPRYAGLGFAVVEVVDDVVDEEVVELEVDDEVVDEELPPASAWPPVHAPASSANAPSKKISL